VTYVAQVTGASRRSNRIASAGVLARLGRHALLLLMTCWFATACSSYDTSDLQQFVEETRAAQKGRIDPLPPYKAFETYAYAASNLRDPFTPWRDEREQQQVAKGATDGPQPDFNRRKEALEGYPLDTLRMVGTLARDDGEWAIIRGPDGVVHRVKQGNYLGQNHGKIIALREDRIDLKEIVPDGLGGWLERDASLTLVE